MNFSLRRLGAIARKEVIQLRRDPRSLGMAFVVPAAMIVIFGYVISFDVNDIKLAVLLLAVLLAVVLVLQFFFGVV